MSRASIQARADKKRGYRKDYTKSAAKIAKKKGGGGGSNSNWADRSLADQRKLSGYDSSNPTAYDRAIDYTAGYTDASGNTITPGSLSKNQAYQPPATPPVTDLTGQSNQINAMLAGATGGTYDPATGFVNPTPTDTTGEKGFEDLFKSYMGTQGQLNADRPSQESFVREMQKELRPKENLVNSLQNQITSITTDRDAAQLGLEGQGRGITDTIIGGQQARIGREAAIQALPIQAQLAAAQGDLDSARTYLGQLYQAKSADAQAEYQYKTSLASSIYGFLNSQQQRRVDAATKESDRKYAETQANIAYQRQLSGTALDFQQNGLISGIAGVDPSSPTFEADMAAYTAQLRKPVAPTSPKAPTTQVIDGQLYQYDYETGQWNLAVGIDGMSGDINGAGGEMDKIAMIRDTIARITGREADEEKGLKAYDPLYKKASQTPVSEFFGRTFTGSSGLDNLKVYADTLKSNMLTLAADPNIKDFFGPQMSNADVQQMMAVATRMQPDNQTPEQLLSETRRIEEFIGKYEAAVKAKQEGTSANFGIPGAFGAVGSDGVDYVVVPDDYVTSTISSL